MQKRRAILEAAWQLNAYRWQRQGPPFQPGLRIDFAPNAIGPPAPPHWWEPGGEGPFTIDPTVLRIVELRQIVANRLQNETDPAVLRRLNQMGGSLTILYEERGSYVGGTRFLTLPSTRQGIADIATELTPR